MMKMGVIADDLTGANDTGVQFSKLGLNTVVVWNSSSVKSVDIDADVVIVDTESRMNRQEEAYSKVKEATKSLMGVGVDLLFKKIDSTLRGNIGAELDGVCDAFGELVVLVAPAFPRNRRTTVKGHQLLDGVPLEYTILAHDSLSPVRQSDIVSLIREQTDRCVSHIPLEVVALGSDSLRFRILAEVQHGCKILVLDAVLNDHLATIARAASMLGIPVLLSGSAGLAEEVPFAFNLVSKRRQVLVVAGSMSEITARQVALLERTLKTKPVVVDLRALLQSEATRFEEVGKATESAVQELHLASVAILTLARLHKEGEERKRQGSMQFFNEFSRQIILNALGGIAAGTLSHGVTGMVLTGGDTAMAVIKAMEAESIKLDDEIEAGIPIGMVSGGRWSGIRVVTKAGAFGDDSSLLRVVEYLKRR
jgi:uncharacterized protein YgbK (DUF1537 family)